MELHAILFIPKLEKLLYCSDRKMGMKVLLTIWALIGAQTYLDMRNHSYREMVEYMKLIKYTCPGELTFIPDF